MLALNNLSAKIYTLLNGLSIFQKIYDYPAFDEIKGMPFCEFYVMNPNYSRVTNIHEEENVIFRLNIGCDYSKTESNMQTAREILYDAVEIVKNAFNINSAVETLNILSTDIKYNVIGVQVKSLSSNQDPDRVPKIWQMSFDLEVRLIRLE